MRRKTITNSKPIYSRQSTLFRYWHSVSHLPSNKIEPIFFWFLVFFPMMTCLLSRVKVPMLCSLIFGRVFAIRFDSQNVSVWELVFRRDFPTHHFSCVCMCVVGLVGMSSVICFTNSNACNTRRGKKVISFTVQ